MIRSGERLALPCAVLLAYWLSFVPLPATLAGLMPFWLALVLIWFALHGRAGPSLALCFALGIGYDLLHGNLIGEHALRLVFLIYIVGRFRLQLRFFPLWQQVLAVFVLLLNDRVVGLWIASLSQRRVIDWAYFASALVGALCYPVLYLLLDRLVHQWARRSR